MPPGEARQGAKLQDILRLLTLWFSHGNAPDVEAALQEGFRHVSIDTWLVVIPQVKIEPCASMSGAFVHSTLYIVLHPNVPAETQLHDRSARRKFHMDDSTSIILLGWPVHSD